MGTKPRPEGQASGSADDSKAHKKKGLWILRLARKRKRRTASQEQLYTVNQNFRTTEEVGDDVVNEPHNHQLDHRMADADIVVVDKGAKDPGEPSEGSTNSGPNKHTGEDKKKMLGSAIKFFKKSFRSTKRRKKGDFSKLAESTDDLVECEPSTSKDNEKSERKDASLTNNDETKGKKRCKGKDYVRFGETMDDDDKENIDMVIDEDVAMKHRDNTESTSDTKTKKKKSARKRVTKAGKKTGKMFGVGMIQIGRNLQYLSPIPTPHVFSEYNEAAKNRTPGASKPKKPTYKYTAKAPPANPYAFV
ncbi:uncharacterized protein [Diadema antillarum]|uniref:uncharacterized protein n=1 Tax=Diadema antillarum TaxID=105358 RepID=UPI003A8A1994